MHFLSPIKKIEHELFDAAQLNIYIKRDDLIHPIISGNKWRKLKYNLLAAQQRNFTGVLSFGGAYSNHIHALAYACKQQNLKSLGIIRGESHYQSNSTLSKAKDWGMEFNFIDRAEYRLRSDKTYLKSLQNKYPEYYIIPEGGSNELALPGVAEIILELNKQLKYDTLILPVGSGGTIAGLIKEDNNRHNILGIAVLKQADYLKKEITKLVNNNENKPMNWQLLTDFHLGGYGKFSNAEALEIAKFSKAFQIPFEPIYSGKMLLALLNLIAQGYFEKDQTIVLLHTGGLQGLKGLAERGIINPAQWHLPPELLAR